MRIKKDNALAGIDMILAIMAVTIFSGLIISLMHNNVMENVKLKKETLAMIYLTQTFENIGIEDYNNVTQSNISNLVPTEAMEDYEVEMIVATDLDDVANNENIMKKVIVTMSYEIDNKIYSCSMQRMKVKE